MKVLPTAKAGTTELSAKINNVVLDCNPKDKINIYDPY